MDNPKFVTFVKKLFPVLLAGMTYFPCTGQSVQILEERSISSTIDFPLNEAHFIIDPQDPKHFLVAAILSKTWKKGEAADWRKGQAADSHIILLQSWDSGATWQEKHFDTNNIASGYDPWLAMNNDGTVLLTSLNTFTDQRFLHFLVFISKDGGKTWTDTPINLGTSHDRQSIVVHPVREKFIVVSTNANRNYDRKRMRGVNITTFTRDGRFIESNWHGIFNVDKINGTPLITSENELIIPIIDYSSRPGGVVKNKRHWIVRSNDLGRTLSEPIMISENTSFPHLLIDTLGTKADILYQLHEKEGARKFLGYLSSSSTDFGYTWDKKVVITPYQGDDAYMRNGDWILNNKGVIGVFWFDRGNMDSKSHNFYFAYSADQGKSFSEPTKISSKPSTPDGEKYMNDNRWPAGGDYFGMATTPNGDFKVVWSDHRDDLAQLYLATIRVIN